MISSRHYGGYLHRGLTLSVLAGVMLSLFSLHSQAQDFNWYARAEIDANYVWRGLYVGGLSLVAEAEVSYYGFFANMEVGKKRCSRNSCDRLESGGRYIPWLSLARVVGAVYSHVLFRSLYRRTNVAIF